MATSRIGLNFSIKEFPLSKNFDVRVNVREEFTYARYGSSFANASVGSAYLSSEPINVFDNIIIEDLTSSIPENSSRKITESIFTEQLFEVDNGSFLITDIFKTTSEGISVPLYKRHELNGLGDIANIQVLDGNLNSVTPDLYQYYDETATLGRESKSVYTNLEPVYSNIDNSYTSYFIRYTLVATGEQRTDILNPVPFYAPAGFGATAKERVYRLSPSNDKTDVEVFFNSIFFSPTPPTSDQRFALKVTADNRIKVIRPVDLPADQRWYLKINLGEFYRNTGSSRLHYYVPEYDTQFFTPVPPFKIAIEQKGVLLDETLIYSSPSKIANLEISGFYIYIAFRNTVGRTVRAFTNDPTASSYIDAQGRITDVFYESDGIGSISSDAGLIKLSKKVESDLTPYLTYRYRETNYTYRGITVNSTSLPKILNKRILVYVVPEGNVTSLSRSVYHLLIDEDGNILESAENPDFQSYISRVETGSTTTIIDSTLLSEDIYTGYELEMITGLNAGRKIKILSYNSSLKEITLSVAFSQNVDEGDIYRINKKAEDYVTSDDVSATNFSYEGWITAQTQAPSYSVLLANVYPVQTTTPLDVDVVDTRIRGGGLKESEVKQALNIQDEVQWYWDVGNWDGKPYPGMGSILVEIPRYVLDEVGGQFTRAEVESVVRKHMASGGYPIIRYYDQSTKITRVIPSNEQIEISWQDVDAGSYNVYSGQDPDNLTLYRQYNGSISSAILEGLENNKTYYFTVVAIVSGEEQQAARTAFAIPFNPSTVKPGALYGETIYLEGTYNQ